MATNKRKLYVTEITTERDQNRLFRVYRVVNSVTPAIGEVLAEEDVKSFCAKTYWTVDIT